ncbi:MAG: hypothetical protein ABWY18_05360 [Tardiphaga sp.]
MDALHSMLRSIHTETKASTPREFDVFREFLAHLDRLQKQAADKPRPRRRQRRVKV